MSSINNNTNGLEQEGDSLYDDGRYGQAINKYEQQLSIIEIVFRSEIWRAIPLLYKIGKAYQKLNQYEEAESFLERSLNIINETLGPDHEYSINIMSTLGSVYRDMGVYEKAERLYRQSLNSREKSLGKNHPDVASSLNRLGMLYQLMGNYSESMVHLKRALIIRETSLGPDHFDVATSQNNLAELYIKVGRFKEAESLHKQSLSIQENSLGPFHPNIAASLNNLAILYANQGNYSKAEPLFQRSLSIIEKLNGENHPYYAISLNSIGQLYCDMGQIEKAESALLQSKSILDDIYGEKHPYVASNLNALASLYYRIDNYDKADIYFNRALVIQKRLLGFDHPDTIATMGNIAQLYNRIGVYAKAETFYRQSLELCENKYGREHIGLHVYLNNLALFMVGMGAYKEALSHLKRSLSIQQKAMGKGHPKLATTINNIAGVSREMGDYAEAESFFKQALDIQMKRFGTDHLDTIITINNLASLYFDMGNYSVAKNLFKQSLEISEKILGSDHYDVSIKLNNLAELYRILGDNTKAELLYRRAMALTEKNLGPEHPDYAVNQNNLALLYIDVGNYAKAKPLLQQALAIQMNAFGPDHLDVATSLNNNAMLYQNIWNYGKAESLYKKALSIREKLLGPWHPAIISIIDNLTILFSDMRRYKEAYATLQKSIAISEKLIDDIFVFASDRQKQSFLAKHKQSLHFLLEMTIDHFGSDELIVSRTTDQWLERKGILMESQRLFYESLLVNAREEDQCLIKKYFNEKEILSNLFCRTPKQDCFGHFRNLLNDTQQNHDDLEKQLLKLSSKFQESMKPGGVGWREVADALPEDTTLLDFASLWDKRFLAFIVHSGSDKYVQLIDLGSGEEISKLIRDLRIEIRKGKDQNIGFDEKLYYRLSRKLYQKIIKPLKGALGTVGHYIISPDGALCLLPFEILINENDEYLMEEEGRLISYITAPRDLLYGPMGEKRNRALLIGDPDYDWDGYIDPEPDSGYTSLENKENKEGNRSFLLADHDFGRLKATTYEVDEIASYLTEKYEHRAPFTRWEAREELLSEARDFGIIHIATHGFFLPIERRKETKPLPRDDKHNFPMARSADSEEEVYVENPLLRSGLAFAGANVTLDKKTGSQGILTAEKVLSLPLRGTDLLVLSACNTGIGDVSIGEGVFGLQRAFSLAGVANLVMSLWKVPDYETKNLMVNFYKYMIEDEEHPRIALSKATRDQLKMMRDRFDTKHPNPYFWSGFVLSGRP